jgi:O-antigen/teichoic acid export membrane protein
MLKKLFSHTAIYGLAPQIPKIAGIFALPIITKYLTAVDFGIYGLITALVAGISIFASLGLNVVLSNSFFKHPNHYKSVWRQIYGFLIIWNIPYAILLGLIIYLFVPKEATQHMEGIIICNVLPIVFFGPTSILGNLYYQLNQKPLQIAIRSSIFGFLTISLNIYFIAFLKLGYMGWFISGCISQMLSQLSFWIPLNFKYKITPIFKIRKNFIKQKLAISLPVVPHYYGSYLLNMSDRIVMKFANVSTGNIGLYNAAYTVGNTIQLVGNASGQAISPMLMKTYKEGNDLLARRLIFTLQLTFLAGTFLCSIWLKEVFFILIKNEVLQKVYPLGIIIVMSNNYRPMYYAANFQLMYFEKTKILLKVTFIAGITNVILNAICIPVFGYEAAAYTTFAGLMYMGYAGFFLKEFKANVKVNYYPGAWFVITCVLTVAAYYCVELSTIVKVLISVIAGAISLIGFKKLQK